MSAEKKRSTVWAVERSDWFGDCEEVAHFDTEAEAKAEAKKMQRASRACDDPADKVTYAVVSYEWVREL